MMQLRNVFQFYPWTLNLIENDVHKNVFKMIDSEQNKEHQKILWNEVRKLSNETKNNVQ